MGRKVCITNSGHLNDKKSALGNESLRQDWGGAVGGRQEGRGEDRVILEGQWGDPGGKQAAGEAGGDCGGSWQALISISGAGSPG